MPLIVQKYGGSSIASTDHIKLVARQIIAKREEGYDMIVVVSAMGETTNHLLYLAHQVNPNPNKRELDMLLSVGERISISLVALAINAHNKYEAISYTGSQVGIITDTQHTDARILEIKGDRIRQALSEGKIVIVAGFQGVSIEKEITTLGRGGSDTTAVALAAALGAEVCEIMTDVDGVYTANPNEIPNAKRLNEIGYDEMLEFASVGAKILKNEAVEYAKQHNVKLAVGSTFTGKIGTIVTNRSFEKRCISGIAHQEILLITLPIFSQNTNNHFWKILTEYHIEVRLAQMDKEKIQFVILPKNKQDFENIIKNHHWEYKLNSDYTLLSLIGTGVNIHHKEIKKVMQLLEELNISLILMGLSETKLDLVIPTSKVLLLQEHLHKEFFEF